MKYISNNKCWATYQEVFAHHRAEFDQDFEHFGSALDNLSNLSKSLLFDNSLEPIYFIDRSCDLHYAIQTQTTTPNSLFITLFSFT